LKGWKFNRNFIDLAKWVFILGLIVGLAPVAVGYLATFFRQGLVYGLGGAAVLVFLYLIFYAGLRINNQLTKAESLAEQTEVENMLLKERWQALLNVIGDGVALVDLNNNGHIVETNKSFHRLVNLEPAILKGMPLIDIGAVSERSRFSQFIEKLTQTGSSSLNDLLLAAPQEPVWVELKGQVIEGKLALITLKDITQSKKQYILTEKEISFLHELSRTLPLFQDFDQVLEKIINMLCETLNFNAFALIVAEPVDQMALIYIGKKTSSEFLSSVKSVVSDVYAELIEGIGLETLKMTVNRKTDIKPTSAAAVNSQIILPLAIVNGMAGLFSVEQNAYKKEDLSLFSTMVSGISSLYIAYQSYQRIQELSVTDSLTGLYNRRKFFEEIEKEVERARRYGSRLSLIMLDIDHFKQINDKYGHQVGDTVLRKLAEVLKTNTRKTDLVARYGGEEFIIMLTETPIEGAEGVADRIKTALEKVKVSSLDGEVQFTASFGLSCYMLGDNVNSLISRSDQALYAAKNNGRNRIEVLL